MASPQLENGFTRIANELLEAITGANLSAREFRVVLVVVRKSYGFNSKMAAISLSDFAEVTGVHRSNIPCTIRSLERKKVLLVERNGRAISYGVQKDYSQWVGQINTTPGIELAMSLSDNNMGKSIPPTDLSQINTTPGIKSIPPLSQINTPLMYKETLKDKEKERAPAPQKKKRQPKIQAEVQLSELQQRQFDTFWSAYPKKLEKYEAKICWSRLLPSEELFRQILRSVEAFKLTREWQEESFKFAPNPSTWLNKRRWMDEPTKPGNGGSGPPVFAPRIIPSEAALATALEPFSTEILKTNWVPAEQAMTKVGLHPEDSAIAIGEFRNDRTPRSAIPSLAIDLAKQRKEKEEHERANGIARKT